MKRRTAVCLLSVAAVLSFVACEDDDVVIFDPVLDFTATMTGLNERPNPVSPAGTGTATFRLDEEETTLSYTITVTGMTSAITAAHIHLGNASVAGGAIVLLTLPVNGQTVTGTVTRASNFGLGLSFESLIALMRTGDTYINVHTANNLDGETRGQIDPED